MGFDLKDTGFHIISIEAFPVRSTSKSRLCCGNSVTVALTRRVGVLLHPPRRQTRTTKSKTPLELEELDVAASRDCLAEVGNLSSASVLVVLKIYSSVTALPTTQKVYSPPLAPGFPPK